MRNEPDAYRLYFSIGSSFNLATDTQPSNLLKAVWNNGSFIYNFQWPLALRHAVNQIELSLCKPEIILSHLDTQTLTQHMLQLKWNGDQTYFFLNSSLVCSFILIISLFAPPEEARWREWYYSINNSVSASLRSPSPRVINILTLQLYKPSF